jgi:hypothetical protein
VLDSACTRGGLGFFVDAGDHSAAIWSDMRAGGRFGSIPSTSVVSFAFGCWEHQDKQKRLPNGPNNLWPAGHWPLPWPQMEAAKCARKEGRRNLKEGTVRYSGLGRPVHTCTKQTSAANAVLPFVDTAPYRARPRALPTVRISTAVF